MNSEYIKTAILHSEKILGWLIFIDVTNARLEYKYYPPVFNFIMITVAAITLTEFPSFLGSITATLQIMEEAYAVIRKQGRVDSVYKWAIDVMRRMIVSQGQDMQIASN